MYFQYFFYFIPYCHALLLLRFTLVEKHGYKSPTTKKTHLLVKKKFGSSICLFCLRLTLLVASLGKSPPAASLSFLAPQITPRTRALSVLDPDADVLFLPATRFTFSAP
ncbi:hypothetical protein SORBI_3009G088401 [Sorghum bicolor]|uniref:Uncharacterized protein n=1 Tax=Sorghum bicolor TaxID=4558 RepID=A0A1Z5R1P1_SORBI|nr:hypothetical protein SORBI_3009G088401 [Sorghum bicolor]